MGEELLGAQMTGSHTEARSWRAASVDRAHCGGVVREIAAAAIGVQEDTNPTRPGEDQGGKLPRKKGTAVSWPRRGCMGLRLHNGASSHGGSRSGGAGFFPSRTGYCRRRFLRHRLGPSGNIKQGGGEWQKEHPQGKVQGQDNGT
jgi:hypothetical protein